jgi:succinate dehydrogenase hydrophobic anchor subunit
MHWLYIVLAATAVVLILNVIVVLYLAVVSRSADKQDAV